MVRSQVPPLLTISQLTRQGQVGVETIRFYQRKALLPTPPKGGGIRRYDDEAVRRLRFIRQAQTAGFSLEEIRELLLLDAGQDRCRARAMAQARIAALNARIDALGAARDALQRLAQECAEGTTGPCPILSAFEPRSGGR